MSEIIRAVREIMNITKQTSMNVNDILRKIGKSHLSIVKVNKEELMEVLNHYKKLQIVYVDEDENVVFL